ncbi:metallophosphoesterase family protein [Pseudobacteroides cellulosolvens]|uniref:Metallophosphoesterase n=1 Tax=Pseudobacteroides cellulosolvens ATCC 35603 = DSM 2933 TaxID=398512 RepID=A0A0L6JPP0_9FIRM|nr:metallophosphoesterase [Pseudobacteroides cellulosolvens]KNY27675.1 metallophosphoesterase [Pseudobacteroides cellulosolvens ATCC 35603 = DSM 2933]
MKELNWIHMSDIHYNFENYDTQLMRDKTLSYLQSLKTKFQFMVITGDIRYKGKAYTDDTIEFIRNIAENLNISINNVFVIPGNHDVKRSPKRELIIKGIISSEIPSDEINKLDDETFNDLLIGQSEFFDFYKKLTGNDYKKENFHFVESRDGYNIIHINTCLISGFDGEDEQRKLLIGQKKLREALKILDHDVFNVAIGHHSIECLDPKEQERLIHNLSDCQIDMYLSGHVHKPNATFDVNNENNLLLVSCGSGMCDDFSSVGLITGFINMETGDGKIAFHKWSQKLDKWIKDNEVLRNMIDNIKPIKIKKLEKKN